MVLVCTFRPQKEIYLSFFSKNGFKEGVITPLGRFFGVFLHTKTAKNLI